MFADPMTTRYGVRHGGNHRKHGDGTAPAHRAGHDGMQEGADRERRAIWPRPRSCCASRAAPRRRKAASRVAAEGVIGLYRRARRASRRDGRGQLRDRLRRQERRFPSRSRRRSRRLVARKNPADVGALSALALASGEHRRGAPRGAGAEDRREHVAPPLRAHATPKGKLASYVHGGARSACWSTSTAATTRWARISRCTSPRASRWRVSRDERAGRSDREGARRSQRRRPPNRASPPTSSRRWSKAASHKFLGGSDAARPAVRQERRQADGRAAAEGAGRDGARRSCCTSSAKASRRRRTTSPPKSPRWRRRDSARTGTRTLPRAPIR